jgi:hypothetical protein
VVREHRLWNRVGLHQRAYTMLRQNTALGSQMINPAYTSHTCSRCGALGARDRHRFVCECCGLRAHADLNASRNLARMGETAVSPRAAVNTPDVGCVDCHATP